MVEGALAGKVAVVTGASRGLGRAISHELAKDGARIALVGRDSGTLDEVVREITSNGGRAQAFQADVSSEDAVLELERGVAAAMGPVSILVNNAGINIRKQMTEYSLEEWRRVLDTNLTSVFLLCRSFVPHMKGKGYGRVINIGSMMGWVSLPGRGAYTASKGGMLAVTRTLALELAGEGITANTISPGLIGTEMNTPLIQNPEIYQSLTSRIPVGRWGKPEEIGRLAAYLCRPEAAFITGADVLIDGGWCAQ